MADPHATPDRAASGWWVTVDELERLVTALRDRDCPYLGNYKLGYDAALDDLIEWVRNA